MLCCKFNLFEAAVGTFKAFGRKATEKFHNIFQCIKIFPQFDVNFLFISWDLIV